MIAARARSLGVTAALVAGAGLGAAAIADAAGGGSGSQAPAATMPAAPMNPATVAHGPGETLLTGTAASRARAAALAAVPGASVIRVETDSAGAAYEAHLTRSDGTQVTVKLDRGFHVTATESGFGGGPPSPSR
jgi:hypothetical protein